MEFIKKYAICLGYTFIFIIGATLILTILNYFNIIKGTMLTILKVIIPLASIFISSIKLGLQTNEKGYIEGLKLGTIFIFIIFLFSILGLSTKLSLFHLLYYIAILLFSVLGAMLGINKKQATE